MRAVAALFLTTALFAQVTYESIRDADREPGNWLTYSRTYSAQRYSPLAEINAANVKRLRPAWIYQIQDLNFFEATPIVVDRIMYVSEPPSNVTALDTRTGRPLWVFRRPVPSDVRLCCGLVNRGVAILGDRVFIGTVDAHLLALDAKTGHLLWDSEVADYRTGHSITVAPLAVKNKIIVGIAGGEYGVRGFLDAYDAATGERVWRFWTVPGPGEPGHDSWAGDSWRQGAATTWVTGSYDPDSNLIFWGTGNPGPDYDADVRKGDNLYANSLIAVDADTGKLRWHFQFTPADTHDWDSTHVPVLFENENKKLIAVANRNGFYYVLDRTNGRFVAGRAYGKQTWARGLDDSGRPMILPGREPTPEGVVVYPGLYGATNWASPAYNPQTRLMYVATREDGTRYYRATAEYRSGAYYTAGGFRGLPGVEPSGSIKALIAATGIERWEFKLHSPPWAGVLTTAGGLVFCGTNEGHFIALDASTGKALWNFQTGGPVISSPMTYTSAGHQYIAIAAGHSLFAFTFE